MTLDFLLRTVLEEGISPALDQVIREFLCVCFPADAAVFGKSRHWHGTPPAYSVLAVVDNSMQGHVGVVIRQIRCAGQPLLVAGVQNLAVYPQMRGSGLGARLITEAVTEARRRRIRFGLLFCDPSLHRFYHRLGWIAVDATITMADENGKTTPIPAKNICMAIALAEDVFPSGAIDLQGSDW